MGWLIVLNKSESSGFFGLRISHDFECENLTKFREFLV